MWRLLARWLLAAGSGAVVYTGYAPLNWWPMACMGIALFYFSLSPWRGERVSLRLGAGLGFVHGVATYALLLPWIGELVGNTPYLALAAALSLYAILTGLCGAAIARWRFGFLAFPFIYLTVEFVRSSVPFGGFAWVRLAWGQVNGPLAQLVQWGGPALVTVAASLLGTSLVAVWSGRHAVRFTAIGVIVAVFAASFVAGWTRGMAGHETGRVTVAAVQGNVPRMGLDFNAQRRAVLNNHVRVTKQLAEDGHEPDLVIWPENSSDVNPFTDEEARASIESAVEAVGVPMLVGTLTYDEVGARNTMQVFEPGGHPGDRHYKKYLQPFGETMPMRDFFAKLSDYVELAGDFKPGDGNGVVNMAGVAVGVATCYEVIFDQAFRTAVQSGAQILTTPTNNATFGFSDMTYQQLAMSRMRALETDRAVVVPATSGVSAIVHPDGKISQESNIFEAKYLVEDLPLRSGETLAVRFGSILELAMVIIGGVLTLAALISAGSRRSAAASPTAARAKKNTRSTRAKK